MSTNLRRLPKSNRIAQVILAAGMTLLSGPFVSAQTTTSTSGSPGAAPSQPGTSVPGVNAPASPSQPATGSFATNRGLVNPTNRNQIAVRPGAVVATRSLSQARRGNAALQGTTQGTTLDRSGDLATTGLTAQQRVALQQQLAGMDARLDDLIDAVDASSGTQRDRALSNVVQELASQISAIRQAMLTSGFSSFERLADGRTIFITPSSVQSQDRRVNGLDTPATAGSVATVNTSSGVPLLTNTGAISAPVSGMSMQAAQRRGSDPNEPVVASDGF